MLSNFFLVLVLIASKEWLLDNHVSPLWLAVRVLGCGSMGALAWVAAGAGDVLINEIKVSETALYLGLRCSIYVEVVEIGDDILLHCGAASCFVHDRTAHVSSPVTFNLRCRRGSHLMQGF